MSDKILLRVKNLSVSFKTGRGLITAASDVNFDISRGELMAIVGESGSGKSVTALSFLRLLPSPPAKINADAVELLSEKKTIDLLKCSEAEMRSVRGNKISMIFQEPMTSLNPTLTTGRQITEVLELHRGMKGAGAEKEAARLLAEVGMPDPERQARVYPHQLSGGMRQRVMIAAALSCGPQLLIADEPTTALDVTIQAQILRLMDDLRARSGMAVLLITHNMGIVAEMADSIAVMYAGQIVEKGSAREVMTASLHPYTKALLDSVPTLTGEKKTLRAIKGSPPTSSWPSGCRFHPRCAFARPECSQREQKLVEKYDGHFARCEFTREHEEKSYD